MNSQASMKRSPAFTALSLLDAEVDEDALSAPGWPSIERNCFFASAWCGEFARPG